jgi:hypothetical protein
MKILEGKKINYKQSPDGIHMFAVGWFVELVSIAEMYNEILERVAKRKDYIALLTIYLPKVIDFSEGFGSHEKPTKEMREYMLNTLSRGINDAVNVLEDYNFSKKDVKIFLKKAEEIKTNLSND